MRLRLGYNHDFATSEQFRRDFSSGMWSMISSSSSGGRTIVFRVEESGLWGQTKGNGFMRRYGGLPTLLTGCYRCQAGAIAGAEAEGVQTPRDGYDCLVVRLSHGPATVAVSPGRLGRSPSPPSEDRLNSPHELPDRLSGIGILPDDSKSLRTCWLVAKLWVTFHLPTHHHSRLPLQVEVSSRVFRRDCRHLLPD